MASEYALTLDISSSCTGYAFGVDGSLLKYGKWVNKNYDKGVKDHGRSLWKFSSWLSRIIRGCEKPPDVVVIESPYYNRNPRTYQVLSKFLGVAEREIRRILPEVEIKMVSSAVVKKKLKVKGGKTHHERKLAMVKRINKLLGLNLKYHKSNKKISQDDVADAIAILIYHFST